MVCCGRPVTRKEIKEVQETVSLFSNLSRTELTKTICEHLNWRTASGTNKFDACSRMLEKLKANNYLKLPTKRIQTQSKKNKITLTSQTDPQSDIEKISGGFSSIKVEIVRGIENINLWNEYVSHYHYLGYSQPFGYVMRYFIKDNNSMLGCLSFSGAAKAMNARDNWIGWSKNQRLRNLAWVTNNSRFLIFPWVHIKNLASHALGKVARQIIDDWQQQWDFYPVLLETFVDPQFYNGTCYQAANWTHIGMTTGTGLVRKNKSYKTTPKKIYIRPLVKNFRKVLCSENLVKEVTYE